MELLHGLGNRSTIADTVAFVEFVSAPRSNGVWEDTFIDFQVSPGAISPNTRLPRVLVRKLTWMMKQHHWWRGDWIIGAFGVASAGQVLDPSLSPRMLAFSCLAGVFRIFHSLVYIFLKNKLSLWSWKNADMVAAIAEKVFHKYLQFPIYFWLIYKLTQNTKY